MSKYINLIDKVSLIERIIALLLLLILSPLLLLISLISFIDTKRFPLFIQERGLTLSKYRFRMFKFRTIRNDDKLDVSEDKNFILKKPHYSQNISFVGSFLRKTGLDELPQLINIFLGQMKFIGPRALSLSDLEKIKSDFPEFYERRNNLNVMPGIIGLWQVNKDFECSIERLIELDEEYEKNISHTLNIKIFLKAINIVLFGYHIDAIVNGRKLKIYPLIIYATVLSGVLFLFALII